MDDFVLINRCEDCGVIVDDPYWDFARPLCTECWLERKREEYIDGD